MRGHYEILDQYKNAFYGGCWFINATFMAMINEVEVEQYLRGMEALRAEISKSLTDGLDTLVAEQRRSRGRKPITKICSARSTSSIHGHYDCASEQFFSPAQVQFE
jgi:hypothetical protein